MFNLLYLLLSISASELLAEIDGMRNPTDVYMLRVELVADNKHYDLEVYVKGKDKSLIKFLAPSKWRGRLILLNGENMWFYVPQSRPIRIAPIHRLVGGFSNADIAVTYFSQDYTPILLKEDENQYLLELKPISKKVAYGRIELWVNKSGHRLIKGRFYSHSGCWLKEAYYTDYKKFNEAEYYTCIEIIDKIKNDEKTIMKFLYFKTITLPDQIFNKDNLPYFK